MVLRPLSDYALLFLGNMQTATLLTTSFTSLRTAVLSFPKMKKEAGTHHVYTVHWCSCGFPVQAPGTHPHHYGAPDQSIHGCANVYSQHHIPTTNSRLTNHQVLPVRRKQYKYLLTKF